MNLKNLSQTPGLSRTTVSRALNFYPEVSAKTRHPVAEAARQHNYRRNARDRSLATGRAGGWRTLARHRGHGAFGAGVENAPVLLIPASRA